MKFFFTSILVSSSAIQNALADFNGLRRLSLDSQDNRRLAKNCDRDGDGFGSTGGGCGGDDCNDNNVLVNTDATELCGDLIDNNCNGQIDEGCDGGGGGGGGNTGTCADGSQNEFGDCTQDADCGGACVGGTEAEKVCTSDDNCLPNNGKPSERGLCDTSVSVGTCVFAPTDPPTKAPTKSPTKAPTAAPTTTPGTGPVTYFPGDLNGGTCDDGKLTISTGMACTLLTTTGQRVQFTDGSGGESTDVMHDKADGATVIPHPSDGGYYYVSNSEVYSNGGGVGSIRFNAAGQVIGYEKNLDSSGNCGGGRTPWNTWLTAEENSSNGEVYEVDPVLGNTRLTNVADEPGNYESLAYDDQDTAAPAGVRFFLTEDASNGALVRYTPTAEAFSTGNNFDKLSSAGGTHDYLLLNNDGTFTWTTNRGAAESNAGSFFPNSEGIDCYNRILNFVSKVEKKLFTLDLATKQWSSSSTVSGAFNLQPDQLARVIGDREVIYFCEDGGSNCDVHGRDSTGNYFTIIVGYNYSTETTGLAFSPNNKFMYVSFQRDSNIYSFWRTDGYAFDAAVMNTKYHAN